MTEPTESSILSQPESSGIARAAAIIALGNIAGRVLGLARETVKSDLFGAVWGVDAFQIASVVPIQLYELLVGGMVTSGLVPVFSDYVEEGQQDELWCLVSTLITLGSALLAGLVVLTEAAAPLIAWLLGRGFDENTQQLATGLLRVTLPAVFFLSLSGILTGLLYTLKRFSLPAFTSSVFNASIVIAALLLGTRLNVMSMAIGILAGSILQIVLQLPGLGDTRLRWRVDWHHPGLRRLVRLYGPVAASLIISQVAIYISYGLASMAGEGSIAWMNYATTLIQFPLGLVATAVSIAILPTLSRQATNSSTSTSDFMETLAHGLKLVLLLIIPATVGLFVMAQPIIGLLFEHGQFGPQDTLITTHVLRFYLLGLAFAAIDQPLIFAFYARKDTLTPAVVGLICIFIYLAAALLPTLFRPLHVTDLALANSIQWVSHALIMLTLLARRVGKLHSDVLQLTTKAIGSSLVMGLVTLCTVILLGQLLSTTNLLGELVIVLSGGLTGIVTYLGLVLLLKVKELDDLWQLIRQRTS